MVSDATPARSLEKPFEAQSSAGIAVVTGAAGFIGSWLCEALLAAGWRVRGIDAFTTNYDPEQKRANLESLLHDPRFELVKADLTVAELDGLLDSADVVAHLAGEPGLTNSWGAGVARFVECNLLATERLLDAAASSGLRRFVYASSSSVYGNGASRPVRESAIPRPTSPYGVTKLAAEQLVRVHASQGLPAVSLRYFSVYGPRQRPDMALHRFIEAALDGRPMILYGDGHQVRDFTYVGDVVAATIAALTGDLEPGTAINVAGGHPFRIADLATLVGRLMGLDVPVEHEPVRVGDVARTNGSVALAGERLGWQPKTDLTVGVRNQIEWHLARRQARPPRPVGPTIRPVAERQGARLLTYTQDGLGLGHLRRAASVAAEFLRREPAGWVLTISDSPLGTLLPSLPNHDYLKLPSIVKAGPGDWRPLSLPLDFSEVQKLRARLILEAVTAFRPDVLLVDHMPHGAMGELLPTLEALRDSPTRVVLGVRDIIDAPSVVKRRWRAEGALDALTRYYDQVLVYGSRDVFNLSTEYGWPAKLAALVRYCGYVCTPDAPADAKRVRARRLAGLPRGRMVVAMAGGGADAHELMSTLLDAVPQICAEQPSTFVIVTGPFMPDDERRSLKRRAEKLPVRLRTMVRDPLSYVAAADLVVSMAGYNTTMEVLRLGTPALLVPRRGPSCEQRMRARRFAERGWVSQLDPDELSPGRLAEAVLAAISAEQPADPVAPPDLDGLARAVEHLHAAALSAHAGGTASERTPIASALSG
jgi:predicted glycosyltransferase/nucleoside-diphosphate-sugar epimerase